MPPCKSQASGLTWSGHFSSHVFPLRRDASQEGYQHFWPFPPLSVKNRSFLDPLLLNPQFKSLGCLVLLLFDSHFYIYISFIAGNERELVIVVGFALWPTCIKNGTNFCIPRWGRRAKAVSVISFFFNCFMLLQAVLSESSINTGHPPKRRKYSVFSVLTLLPSNLPAVFFTNARLRTFSALVLSLATVQPLHEYT